MRTKLLALSIIASGSAFAIQCDNDADCLSASLSLIKKAVKLGACRQEVESVANAVRQDATAARGAKADALDHCVYQAKTKAKFEKKLAKRLERINKALGKNS